MSRVGLHVNGCVDAVRVGSGVRGDGPMGAEVRGDPSWVVGGIARCSAASDLERTGLPRDYWACFRERGHVGCCCTRDGLTFGIGPEKDHDPRDPTPVT